MNEETAEELMQAMNALRESIEQLRDEVVDLREPIRTLTGTIYHEREVSLMGSLDTLSGEVEELRRSVDRAKRV